MILRSSAALLGAAFFVALVQPARASQPPAQAFADPAFGWRDVSGLDLHAALARRPWARVVVALRPAGGPLGDAVSSTRVAAVQNRVLGALRGADFRLTERWSEIPAFAGLVSRVGLARLTASPDVLRVDLDVGGGADDVQSLPLVRGDTAHSQGFVGAGATVAVLDSGVETSDPDLSGRVVSEHCFCANPNGSGCCRGQTLEAADSGSASDDNGHGTNVAGIIASAGSVAPKGVAPSSRIVAVKVLAADGSFTGTSQVISGLNWVLANHPEVKVVNMSLGTIALFDDSCDSATAYTIAFASAINILRSRGGLVFVASGNNASKTSMSAPACIAGAVAVGAVYDDNVGGQAFPSANCTDAATLADQVTCFSNSSPALDLLAPGALITSAGLGAGLSTYAGTSQACPHAAGGAAVLFAAAPAGISADTVENALKSSGKSVTDGANERATPRVDVDAALEKLALKVPPATTSPPPPPASVPPAVGVHRRPQIEVRPSRIDFSRVRTLRASVRELVIRNVGDLALQVAAPSRLGGPFSLANHPGPLTVPRGGTVRLKLVFRPRTPRQFAATLVLSSDDVAHPRIAVQLTGIGVRR